MQEENDISRPLALEPGSFRDPDNQIFTIGDEVYRALSAAAFQAWDSLAQTRFAPAATQDGSLISGERADVALPPSRLPDVPWAAALHHPRIPFISYPYEWPFGMLKNAAQLTLTLLENALSEDWILKDSSPYNVQWQGCRPIFIDTASFVPWTDGQPWRGYAQFCELFLYPLMLQAYRGIAYQAWLRSSLEGISARECWNLLGGFSRARPAVLKHVGLHVWMDNPSSKKQSANRDDLQKMAFSKPILMANIKSLKKLLSSLEPAERPSAWTNYDEERNYDARDYQLKLDAVRDWLSRKKRAMVWDLGCNAGDFSRVAAVHAQQVVAMDSDAEVIDRLYRSLVAQGPKNILPLVMNLANPSPDQGWNGRERGSLLRRGKPDVILALAVIHHLSISANIPLASLVQWLAGFHAELIVEFIERNDERVQNLLKTKTIPHADYARAHFEFLLNERFVVHKIGSFRSGRRILYACEPKSY